MEEFNTDNLDDNLSLSDMGGAFVDSMKRNTKQIKEDRGIEMAEALKIKYVRRMEDLTQDIKSRFRTMRSMLDMSPDNTMSLINPSNFDEDAFLAEDEKIGLEIRNLKIKLEIVQSRYDFLFNKKETK